MSLRKQTISGIMFTGMQTFIGRILNLITSMVLARLIAPEEFGVMAIIMVFQGIAQILVGGGFGQALIQKKEISQQDQNAVFYFNISAGLLMFIIMYLSAPWIAAFYEKEILLPAVRLFSFTFVINSLGSVQANMLTRNMRFKLVMLNSLVYIIISSVVSIVLAIRGMGVWALVCGGVAGSAAQTCGFWLFGRWRPTFSFEFSALRGLFDFSSKMLVLTLVTQLTDHMYSLIIGKLYPMADLGFFQRAKNLRQMSLHTFSQPMTTVMFPSFSRLQHDHEKLKRVFVESLDLAMLIYVPLVLGLGAVSRQLVPLLYGERWLPSAEYFSILCWAVVFMPSNVLNGSIIKALGRADLRLLYSVILMAMALVMIVCAAPFGVLVMVWSTVVLHVIGTILIMWFSHKVISIPLSKELAVMARSLCFGGVLYSLVRWLPNVLPEMPVICILLVQLAIGSLFYILAVRLFEPLTVGKFLEAMDVSFPPATKLIRKLLFYKQ